MSGAVAPGPTRAQASPFRVFRSAVGEHLLIVPYTRIFDLDDDLAAALRRGDADAVASIEPFLEASPGEAPLNLVPLDTPPQSLSLNVSSACNLSCTYCYAGRGAFGGSQDETMTWEVAKAAIDRLLAVSDARGPVTIGFLGGEPFVNRALIHRVVDYASAAPRGRDVRFSVTTNGTLLDDDDVAMLRAHAFAVTVSVDGGRDVQDAQRPIALGKSRRSSHARVERGVAKLLTEPGRARVGARATVVSGAFGPSELAARFEAIVAMGFSEVGFSPVRGEAHGGLRDDEWARYFEASKRLADDELARALRGEEIRFTNFAIALKQLHRGASMPYPCGAGGGYFSVSARGDWYACHRAIGDESFLLGDNDGLDAPRREAFLRERHVHNQPACRTCWARYLCSGSCHQEASSRSDSSCGFVRDWLELCLGAYCELSSRAPSFFSDSKGQAAS